ncbi:MAG: hypothetical protein HQL35_06185 [Alphaproteobacteria bacterium]|nr:hypothetical protein [Alphaproteobacteria bacterium]
MNKIFALFGFIALSALPAAAEIPAAQTSAPVVEVRVKCMESGTQFKVQNFGAKWDELGEISIRRSGDGAVVSKRKVRMMDGQVMTFKIAKEKSEGQQLTLDITPKRYTTAIIQDANSGC